MGDPGSIGRAPLRIGLVGLGAVGELHLKAYQAVRSVAVIAAVELDGARCARLADVYGFRGYGDVATMLAAEQLDLVCVLTPASTHGAIAAQCAEAGLHILCEKPLAPSLREAEAMVEVCRKHGVRLFYGASYRHLPAVKAAKALIASGAIGTVRLMREQIIGGAGPGGHHPLSDIHYPKGGPGGSGLGLVDHGVHLIDTFGWLIDGTVEKAWGRGDVSGETHAPEFLHMEFDTGAIGQLTYDDGTYSTAMPGEGLFSLGAGWDFHGPIPAGGWQANPQSIHIHGTEGSLRIFHYAHALYLNNAEGIRQVELHEPTPPAHFGAQIEQVARILAGAGGEAPEGEAGVQALRVLYAAYGRSLTSGH